MIYKLKLIFNYPLALPQAPRLMRIEFAGFHSILATGLLTGPGQTIGVSILALILLAIRSFKSTPYTAEHIMFAWQRVLLVVVSTVVFMALFSSGEARPASWLILSKVLAALCAYDAYLAFNGIPGLFFINLKKLSKQ